MDTEELKVFTVAKRHGWFHHWEPIHITTHEEPLFDERLTYEGKHDKHTQVLDLWGNHVFCLKNKSSFLCQFMKALMEHFI